MCGCGCAVLGIREPDGCGMCSTLGPMIAAELGISTVDIGFLMLSMHSIREQAGTTDIAQKVAVIQHIYEQG